MLLTTRQLKLQATIAAFLISYWASTIFVRRPPSGYNSIWDGWIYTIAELSPIVPVLLRARRSSRLRSGWLAIAAGIALYTSGDLVWTYYVQNLHPVPDPSLSDVLYLSAYAAFIVGVTVLTQGAFGRVHRSVRIDGAISGLAMASFAGLLWFTSLLHTSGNSLQIIVNMAYPLGDLVLLVLLVAGLAPNGYRPNWPTAILMLGVTWFVVGDVVYLNQVAAGTYTSGTPLDATWMTGLFFYGFAASVDDRRRSAARRTPGASVFRIAVAPAASGLLSIGVIAAAVELKRSPVVELLALGALGLVIVRMWIESAANHHDARTDELTHLANRRCFLERVDAELMTSQPHQVGVILIDLDDFKEINDSMGHVVGDELLRVVGERFEHRLAARGTLARIGGDEFACAVRVVDERGLEAIARDLALTLSDPFVLDGIAVRVVASIGVAVSSDENATAGELLRGADVAMYEAKRTQSGVSIYRATDDTNSREQMIFIASLREAIESRALSLQYQPTVNMQTGKACGVEALVRWQHPTLGLLAPLQFLPVAERAGLMQKLTRVVLHQAVAEAARLDSMGHRLQMSVNISRHDLMEDDFPTYLDRVLEWHSYPLERLTLEITESALGSEPERAGARVEELRAMGVQISIDDFGTGFSSLSQLLKLSVDEIKIDKSFIIGICDDMRAQAIVRSAIEMARALDVSVVAEGIESEAIFQALQCIGSDIGQGYFIARPLDPQPLEEFLSRINFNRELVAQP